ncbi:MAG: YebC/PmpR family DNA-binding transcriptional regulator [Chloroflexota bacterium]
MSGHSKWSTIKRKKAATDAKRGQLFTRLAREITIVAREGGDPSMNFKLRLAIENARRSNMPKENVERAIKRGTGELKGEELQEVMYEGYGPNGIAMLIEVVTDNRNRSVADVRRIFSKLGGSMAEPGAVAWQFKHRGYVVLPTSGQDGDLIFELALDANADDVVFGEELIEIFTTLEHFQGVQEALETNGIQFDTAELTYFPDLPTELETAESLKVMRFVDALEELDDVQRVYSSLHITDELMSDYEETLAD